MKIHTLDELLRQIQDDLSWRRKELRVLGSLVKRSEAASQQAILRGAIASLYAHWEGYVKFASAAYIDFVRLRGLKISELQVNFVALVIKPRIKHIGHQGNVSEHCVFVQWLLDTWNSKAYLPASEKLTTQSNLNSVVFREIVAGIGIAYKHEFHVAEKGVIEPLLEARNNLAHGGWQRVEQSDFENYCMWIDKLLQMFCDAIEDAAVRQLYRRQLPTL